MVEKENVRNKNSWYKPIENKLYKMSAKENDRKELQMEHHAHDFFPYDCCPVTPQMCNLVLNVASDGQPGKRQRKAKGPH